MESRVEHYHLRSLGENLGDGVDAKQVGGIVERCEVAADFNLLQHIVIDKATSVEEIGTLHDAVTHCIYIIERIEYAMHGVDKGVHHKFHSEFVVRNGQCLFERLLARRLVSDVSFGETDFLHQTLCLDGIVVGALHIEQLVFDRRTAAVDNKYDHILELCVFKNSQI